MQPDDISDGMNLSRVEGWNQTEKDWELLVSNPDNSCLLAEIGDQVVGTATSMNYANEVACIGMVLVDPEFQGKGISTLLLSTLFEKLKTCKAVRLDATPAGLDSSMPEKIQAEDIQEVVEFDRYAFGANRTFLIESLIKQYPDKSLILKRNNRISGFALGRSGKKYHQIGPLSASSVQDAIHLIAGALKGLRNQPVVVDILDDKQDLIDWLESMGIEQQRHFVRMYLNENPRPGIINKQFLICGPEFG